MEKEKKVKDSTIGGLIFVGCMFIGGGIGMYFDALQVGGAIGMGVGFICTAIIKYNSNRG